MHQWQLLKICSAMKDICGRVHRKFSRKKNLNGEIIYCLKHCVSDMCCQNTQVEDPGWARPVPDQTGSVSNPPERPASDPRLHIKFRSDSPPYSRCCFCNKKDPYPKLKKNCYDSWTNTSMKIWFLVRHSDVILCFWMKKSSSQNVLQLT